MSPSHSQSDDPANKPTPERRAADTLSSAILLALTGGVLDAFLYLDHGHVFAGAMTGNAVLFGIALLRESHLSALQHALPLVAFGCGVWLAEIVQNRLHHHAVTVGLACEAAGLLAASFLPGSFPEQVFVFLIALFAAFQIASFRKADQYSYNSTFITGDMRTLFVGLYEALHPEKRAEGVRQALELGLILVGFFVGTMLGAVLAPRIGNHTLWLAVAALIVVLGMALRRSFSRS